MKANRLTERKAALAEKVPSIKKPDKSFFTIRRYHRELDGSLFNIKDRLTAISLREDYLLLTEKERLSLYPILLRREAISNFGRSMVIKGNKLYAQQRDKAVIKTAARCGKTGFRNQHVCFNGEAFAWFCHPVDSAFS